MAPPPPWVEDSSQEHWSTSLVDPVPGQGRGAAHTASGAPTAAALGVSGPSGPQVQAAPHRSPTSPYTFAVPIHLKPQSHDSTRKAPFLPPAQRRGVALGVLMVGLVLVAATCTVALGPVWQPFPIPALINVVTAVALVTAGAALTTHPRAARSGAWMAGTGVVWATQDWGVAQAGVGPFLSFAGSGLAWAMLVMMVVGFPGDLALTRPQRVFVAVSVFCLLPCTVAAALVSEPQWWQFPADSWWPTVHPNRAQSTGWAVVFGVVDLAMACGAVIVVWQRTKGMSRLERSQVVPAGGGVAAAAVLGAVASAAQNVVRSDDAWVWGLSVQGVGLLAVPATVVWAWLRRRRIRESLTVLVPQLSAAGTVEGVRASLRDFFGEPSVEVLYVTAVPDTYTDHAGNLVPALDLAGRFTLPVRSWTGAPLALVSMHKDLEQWEDLVGAAVAAAGFVIENQYLHDEQARVLATVERSRENVAQAQRDERNRIVNEMHESIRQALYALGVQAGTLQRRACDAPSKARWEDLKQIILRANRDLARVCLGLHSDVLHKDGLAVAISDLTGPLDLSVEVSIGQDIGDEVLLDVLYSCVSEALTNIIKHANATEASIDVRREGPQVVLRIQDNGEGIVGDGPGLLYSLRHRAAQASGTISACALPASGTAVTVRFPVEALAAGTPRTPSPGVAFAPGEESTPVPFARGVSGSAAGPRHPRGPLGPGRSRSFPPRGLGAVRRLVPRGDRARQAGRPWRAQQVWRAPRALSWPAATTATPATVTFAVLFTLTAALGLSGEWAIHPLYAVFACVLGASLVLTGGLLTASERSRASGYWLALAGVLWPLNNWGIGASGIGPFVNWTFSAIIWLPIGAALSCYPAKATWTTGHRLFFVVAALYLGPVSLAQAVFTKPQWNGFPADAWWPTLVPLPHVWAAISLSAGVVYLLLAAWFVQITVARMRTLPNLDRRALRPAMWGAAAGAVIGSASSFAQTLLLTPDAWAAAIFAQGVGLLALPVVILLSWLRVHDHRATIAGVINDLATAPTDGAVRTILSAWLRDETVSLAYWAPDQGHYLTPGGAPVLPPTGVERTSVMVTSPSGEPLALVTAIPGLRHLREDLLAAVAPVGFILENIRLHAQNAAHIRDIASSRAAIVDVARAERERISGDLHDNLQTTMATILAITRTAARRNTDPALSPVIDHLANEARAAVDLVRDVARRLSSRTLREAGLYEALQEALPALTLPFAISVDLSAEPEAAAATCDLRVRDIAYLWTCEAVTSAARHLGAEHREGSIVVDISCYGDTLVIDVRDDAPVPADIREPALAGLRRRAGMWNGTVHLTHGSNQRTSVRLHLPTVLDQDAAPQ